MKNIIEKLKLGLKEGGFEVNFLKKDIQNIDKKELIIEILETKEFRYTTIGYLFLVIPELWEDFQLEDWMYIIRNINRPDKYRILIDVEPCFEDIRFLYNWIGIDSIDLYKNDTEISDENKRNLNRVIPGFLGDTMRVGETYKEDFEDGTFGEIQFFREMHLRLINQGAKASPLGSL